MKTITAGQLRAMGIDIWDIVPDGATTPIVGKTLQTKDNSVTVSLEIGSFDFVQSARFVTLEGRIDMTKADMSALNKKD